MEITAQSLKLVTAERHQVQEVFDMYKRCKENLLKQKIYQWDDNYPNEAYFKEAIEDQHMLLLLDNGLLAGSMVLNDWESEEWSVISWKFSKPLILHSLFLEPSQQGKGTGTEMLKGAEQLARKRGYVSIRLDAFSGNTRSLQFYELNGYSKRGEVSFVSKPEGHTIYFCYEKKL